MSLSSNASEKLIRGPNFLIGDFARITKADIPFRKSYKQKFTNEFVKNYDIPSVNPPVYNITDAYQEPVTDKFYELELVSVLDNSAETTKHE